MSGTNLAEYLDLARNQQQQGKLLEAIATYHQAMAKFPDGYQLYDGLGQALAKLGENDKAIAAFRQGIKLKPNFSWLYYRLARALEEQGNPEEAMINYRQSIKLNDNFSWSYYHLASLLRVKGDAAEAIINYRQSIKLNGNFAWSYYHLANLLRAEGNFSEANFNYQKAIDSGEKEACIHFDFGESLAQQGNWELAIAQYQQAIAIDPQASLFYEKIYFLKSKIAQGNLSSSQDNIEKERSTTKTALEINLLQDKAKTHLVNKDFDLALECYQKIITIDYNYGQIYYQIGSIYEQLNKLEQAQENYQKANILKYFDTDSSVMLVCFSARHITERCPYHFLELVSSFPVKKLFVRDIQDAWYNRGLRGITQDVPSTANYLQNIIAQQKVNKVVFLGASSGGYAALLYGYLLQVNEIHAFGAQTKIPNNPEEIELLKNLTSEYFNLAKIYQIKPNNTDCHLYFDNQFPPDVEHAYRLREIDRVKLHGYCAGVGHKIAMWLKHQAMLEPIILNAL